MKTGGFWIDAATMKAYNMTPSTWYELPRSDRILMAATVRADRALEIMQRFDYAEYERRKLKPRP